MNTLKLNFFMTLLVICFATLIQFVFKIEIMGSEVAITPSDFLLPITCFLIFSKIFNKAEIFFSSQSKNIFIGIGALTVWIFFSLLNGMNYTGEFSNWGFFNKFIGWFVLLIYLLSGAILGNVNEKFDDVFVKTIVIIFIILGLYDYIYFFSYHLNFNLLSSDYQRMQGFMRNPNAFGLLASFILILATTHTNKKILFSKIKDRFVLGLLFTFVLFAASKSSFLGLIVVFCYMIFSKEINFKNLFSMILITTILTLITFNNHTIVTNIEKIIKTTNLDKKFVDNTSIFKEQKPPNYIIENETNYSHRYDSSLKALRLWKEKPIIGIGLGSFLWKQKKDSLLITLHSTPLWIITEMGLIGFILFFFAFIYCFNILWKNSKFNESIIPTSCIFILIFFSVASIGTDIMNQRYLWFIIGWGLFSNKKKLIN